MTDGWRWKKYVREHHITLQDVTAIKSEAVHSQSNTHRQVINGLMIVGEYQIPTTFRCYDVGILFFL